MWGSEFHYNDQGEIDFLKKQMTHTEKTRYLYYISKGINKENEKDLIYNYQDFSDKKIRIPLDQIIYVGDGTSDIPCFSVINKYGGIAIGVYRKDRTSNEWEHLPAISLSQRVSNLVPANYQENSEMMRSLFLGIDSITSRIALRKIC